jgi:hypothetical protein
LKTSIVPSADPLFPRGRLTHSCEQLNIMYRNLRVRTALGKFRPNR